MHQGSCVCGAVKFAVDGAVPAPDACHCTTCRRWSGHVFSSSDVPRAAVTIEGEANITWFASSPKVRRGFCSTCGSSLFFDPLDREKHHWIGIAMGAFDTPTHTKLAKHIFVSEQGDYYDIVDDVPQHQT